MREIKFRGKSLFICDWHIGLFSRINEQAYIEEGTLKIRVKEDTIGQFTGLKDKNKKEIYEGDIISINKELMGVYVVKFNEEQSRFSMYHDGAYETAGFNKDTIENCYEVIGNIYDNPELLDENE